MPPSEELIRMYRQLVAKERELRDLAWWRLHQRGVIWGQIMDIKARMRIALQDEGGETDTKGTP